MQQSIFVDGMTCSACEHHVQEALININNVQDVQVNRRKGIAVLTVKKPILAKTLKKALVDADYDLGTGPLPWMSVDRQVWKDFFIGAIVVAVFILILNSLGLLSTNDFLKTDGGSNKDIKTLILVVSMGVIASLSTCMALVGGLVLMFSATYAENHPGATTKQLMIPQVFFNMGRIIGFGVLGSVIGAIGGLISFSGGAQAVLIALVGIVMLILGVKLSEISPRIAAQSISLPAKFSKITKSASNPFLLGILTFFLPCGFTQAVQLFALSTGDPLWSGILLSAFAFGTTPGLLGISSISAFKRQNTEKLFRFMGVLIIGFAFMNLSIAVSPYITIPNVGEIFAEKTPKAAELSSNVTYDGALQIVETGVGMRGYTPSTATVYAGVPIEWKLKNNGLSCASSMDISGLESGLESGVEDIMVDSDKTVTLKFDKPGKYKYSCSMGMYNGSFTVIDKP
jgi:sulfite exporter TauE/SafE/copper chaperone CopZ/plastocyanin